MSKYQPKKHEKVIKSYNDYQKKAEEQKYKPSNYYTFQSWNVIIELRVTNNGWYYVYTQNFYMKTKPKADKKIEKNLQRTDEMRDFERYGYFKSFEKAKTLFYIAIMDYANRLKPLKKDWENELFETIQTEN